MEKKIEYLVDDTPVDISKYTDEEIERIYQERFGDKKNEESMENSKRGVRINGTYTSSGLGKIIME